MEKIVQQKMIHTNEDDEQVNQTGYILMTMKREGEEKEKEGEREKF